MLMISILIFQNKHKNLLLVNNELKNIEHWFPANKLNV